MIGLPTIGAALEGSCFRLLGPYDMRILLHVPPACPFASAARSASIPNDMAIQSKPEAGRIRGQIRVLLERTSREARARRLPHIAINVAGPSVGSATLPTKRVFEAVAVLSYFVAG